MGNDKNDNLKCNNIKFIIFIIYIFNRPIKYTVFFTAVMINSFNKKISATTTRTNIIIYTNNNTIVAFYNAHCTFIYSLLINFKGVDLNMVQTVLYPKLPWTFVCLI